MDPLYFEALAQLETAGGRKTIKGPKGEDSNNLYNIKDFTGKGYRALDKAEGSNDAYRVYESRDAATADLIGLLSRKYPKALEATDRKEFALALKAGGYATDPAYVEKFVSVYDSLASTGTPVNNPSAFTAAPPAPAPRSLDGLYAAAQGPRPPKHFALKQSAAAAAKVGEITQQRVTTDSEDQWYTRATDQQIAARDATEAASRQSLLDISRAQFMDTFGGDLLKRLARPEFQPDGFVATEHDLVGFSVEEQDALRQATSRPEFEHIKFGIQDHKDRLIEASKSGAGWAVLGGLIGGAPEGYATGGLAALAFARAGVGSIKLAEQGRRAAAAASSLAENVGANVALTAAQDYLSPHIGLQDYVMAGLGGSLGMALHAPRILRGSRDAEADLLKGILDAELESKTRDIEVARKTLGPDADPQAVARKANELQAQRINGELQVHRAALGDDRKLLPNDVIDELTEDAAEAKKPASAPIVAYHGTDAGFTEFDPSAPNPKRFKFPDAQGIFFSPEQDYAAAYGKRVVAAQLDLKNPKVVTEPPSYISPKMRAELEAQGHDGVIFHGDPNGAFPEYVVFRKEQIKPLDMEAPSAAKKSIEVHPEDRIMEAIEGKDEPFLKATAVQWDDPLKMDRRARLAENNPQWREHIATMTNGRTYSEVAELPAGVHVSAEAAANPALAQAIQTIRSLAAKYLPDSTIHIGDATNGGPKNSGEVTSIGKVHMVGLSAKKADGGRDLLHTAIHELGHAIFSEKAGHIPADLMVKIRADYARFLEKLFKGDIENAMQQRLAITSSNAFYGNSTKVTPYVADFNEYVAEQYVKHISRLSIEGDTRISSDLRKRLVDAIRALFEFFTTSGQELRAKGLGRTDSGVHDFFSRVLDGTLEQSKRLDAELPDQLHGLEVTELAHERFSEASTALRSDDDIMRDHGLDTLAQDTPAQRARVKAMVHLYRKAEDYPMPDPARMSKLLQSAPLQAVAPTALKLLQSTNPVARMVAAELLESGSGAGGRRTTAAIAKWVNERAYMGNSINDFQRHYTTWRNANGGGLREDMFGGEKWREFNRAVATEMENRKNGRVSDAPQAIHDAADVLEAAYDRMRKAQLEHKTPGWAALPESSIGYMPHRMAAAKVRDLSPDQARVLHGVLAEQFQALEGFDAPFSQRLASKYMDIMRKRATAGYSGVMNVQSDEAADIVEQAGAAMGMSRDEAQTLAKRVLKAAPQHTRSRLKLDLTRTYVADGKSFQLLDLFETDQLTLLRSQAGRVSGETALMRHGIPGSTGLKLLRDGLAFGKAGEKADNATLEAFDQVAAEFLGQPFGNQGGKWMDRAMQFNSLASLGGIGFNQLAETLNGAVTLGVRHALASVGSLARLRAEILALSKGQKVHNPIIGSLETYGAEFGTDHYKMVFPFDMPDRLHETYGVDTLTAGDRLLRSGLHLQGKLSLWRAITSAQERGMAEQIVHKALRYVREGKNDVHLADMGIDSALAGRIRAELGRSAQFDARGRLQQFDITKMQDREAADAFVQAVHRGTKQIIQGTFIGETGKWAHSSLLKLVTQFKTFSLIAIDKQWNRQVGNVGTAKALGMLLGTMTFAAPIYMVRAGLASIGRPDQDEYLARALHPLEIARQTLNYTALSGLAGDLHDALSAVAGYHPTGGRSGANKSFVGNVVAPAVGKVDDIWGALQNTKDGTDVGALARELPMSRLPWLYPAMNALRPEK